MESSIRTRQPQWFLDPVTRLPNRTLFLNRLHSALAAPVEGPMRRPHRVGIFIVDVYEYTLVKDRYGRRIALGMLREVTRRMEGCIGRGDTLARLENGLFTVLRRIGPGGTPASTTASLLREAMAETFCFTPGGSVWDGGAGGGNAKVSDGSVDPGSDAGGLGAGGSIGGSGFVLGASSSAGSGGLLGAGTGAGALFGGKGRREIRPVKLRLSPRFGAVVAPTGDVISASEVLGLLRYAIEMQIYDRSATYEDPGASCFFIELLEPTFIDVPST